MKSKPHRGSHV